MSNFKTWNGFSNEETYIVNLWLNNDETNYALLQDVLRRYEDVHSKFYYLEWEVTNLIDARDFDNGLWVDLINSALSKVNWLEIVQAC